MIPAKAASFGSLIWIDRAFFLHITAPISNKGAVASSRRYIQQRNLTPWSYGSLSGGGPSRMVSKLRSMAGTGYLR